MICCALLLLLVGGVRAVLLTVLPGRSRHERTPFPPAARRTVGDQVAADRPAAPIASAARTRPTRSAVARTRRRAAGTALVAAGIGWFVTGLVAMHALGIVPSSIGASAWRDVAFHLSGPLVASAGLVLRSPVRAQRRARSASPIAARTTS